MTNDPGDRPDDENPNPFKGTPFEQIFNAFGAGGAAGAGFPGMSGGPGGMPDLSALMSQMQAMMAPHEGSVNWALAKDVARRTVAESFGRAGSAGACRPRAPPTPSARSTPSGST